MRGWVDDVIVDEALRLLARGPSQGAGFPLVVYGEVQNRRPDVIDHIRRRWSGDPYQYVAAVLRGPGWRRVRPQNGA